MYNNLVI